MERWSVGFMRSWHSSSKGSVCSVTGRLYLPTRASILADVCGRCCRDVKDRAGGKIESRVGLASGRCASLVAGSGDEVKWESSGSFRVVTEELERGLPLWLNVVG